MLKLYESCSGQLYRVICAAEVPDEANLKAQEKTNRRCLHFKSTEIKVDGYEIIVKPIGETEKPPETTKSAASSLPVLPTPPPATVKTCKKCSFECSNQGILMRHYKTEHPKG